MSLTCVVPNSIWYAQQPLRFGPISITTRMTVIRLRDGSLWVHSPISPTPELVDGLRSLGTVRYVVAPNKSHHLFFPAFLNAHPEAQGFIAAGLELKPPDLGRFQRIPRDPPWTCEIQGFFIEGLPILNETVWFHVDTGTLILADLLFCFAESNRVIAALVSKLLGVYGRLGMSRTMKLAVKDKRALAMSVLPLLALPVKRVIVAHDQIVEEQPAEKLKEAFAWLR
ncbi:DUF4336 domain-containing protein [Chitinimonas sp.]|uniref:DUF4336 domain-containing protein n=1 Tax=Chitinimonas sp. TaxID=1934313 RepID=UPI0035AF61E1